MDLHTDHHNLDIPFEMEVLSHISNQNGDTNSQCLVGMA